MTIVDVQDAIAELLAERNQRLQADGDEVLRWWTAAVRTSMTDVCTWGPEGVTVIPSDQLTSAQRASVATVRMARTVRRSGTGDSAEEVTRTEVAISLVDRVKASELLGRHLGLNPEKLLVREEPREYQEENSPELDRLAREYVIATADAARLRKLGSASQLSGPADRDIAGATGPRQKE